MYVCMDVSIYRYQYQLDDVSCQTVDEVMPMCCYPSRGDVLCVTSK